MGQDLQPPPVKDTITKGPYIVKYFFIFLTSKDEIRQPLRTLLGALHKVSDSLARNWSSSSILAKVQVCV